MLLSGLNRKIPGSLQGFSSAFSSQGPLSALFWSSHLSGVSSDHCPPLGLGTERAQEQACRCPRQSLWRWKSSLVVRMSVSRPQQRPFAKTATCPPRWFTPLPWKEASTWPHSLLFLLNSKEKPSWCPWPLGFHGHRKTCYQQVQDPLPALSMVLFTKAAP